MKLAEALQMRADLQRRLAQMPSRLANNSKVQEGSVPTEAPDDLLGELAGILSQLEEYTVRINLTNATVDDGEGHTLTSLMARRDMLRSKAEIMRNFLNSASEITPRHAATEIRVLPTVNVAELRKKCDSISKELRQTDMKIQELNWKNDLL